MSRAWIVPIRAALRRASRRPRTRSSPPCRSAAYPSRLAVERLEDRALLSIGAPGSAGSASGLAWDALGSINGTVNGYQVSIDRHDAPTEPIDSSVHTWLVIHGNDSEPTTLYIDTLAGALHTASGGDQVLTLDWSEIAASFIMTTESYIIPVAEWASAALTSYGFSGDLLSPVGHSFGAYVAAETAERISGGVNTIVGLDPAEDVPFGYNPHASGQVDFAAYSAFSWAFSDAGGPYGSAITPGSADEAFAVESTGHSTIVDLFSNMLNGVGSADVLKYFPLARLLAATPGPWVPNQYNHSGNPSSSGTYEAVITADAAGTEALSIDFVGLDFGDAPDTAAGAGPGNYQTLSTDDGPSHVVVSDLYMGTVPDAEAEAFPSAAADGDDANDTDDEDGLVDAAGDLELLVGEAPAVDVQVTNNTGSAATLYGWIDYNGDGVFDNAAERASIAVADGSTDVTVTLTFPVVPAGFVGDTYARFRLSTDAAEAQNPIGAADDGEVEDYPASVHARVVDGHRYVFYDNSYWDGNTAGPNTTGGPGGNGDDGAVATDKSALLPGGSATSANFTCYSEGINGIMVDVAGLADPVAVGDNDLSEFAFKVGNDSNPSGPGWTTGAAPTDVDVRDLGGGVHRVSFYWAAGAIPTRNWLQVTLKADETTTGLAQDDVFYFGNAIGDANLDCKTLYDDIFTIYTGVDFVNYKPITEPCDVNRDGKVLYDDIFACYSCVDFTNELLLIAPPVPPSAPVAGLGAPAGGELLWAAHLAALDELDRRSEDSEEEDRETAADAVFAAYGDE